MMLAKSPSSHMMINSMLRPSALLRRKFSNICGEKTTTQHAVFPSQQMQHKECMCSENSPIDTEPNMPLMASTSMVGICMTDNVWAYKTDRPNDVRNNLRLYAKRRRHYTRRPFRCKRKKDKDVYVRSGQKVSVQRLSLLQNRPGILRKPSDVHFRRR